MISYRSLVMGCLTQANFSTLPVNDRFVLPFIAHACSIYERDTDTLH